MCLWTEDKFIWNVACSFVTNWSALIRFKVSTSISSRNSDFLVLRWAGSSFLDCSLWSQVSFILIWWQQACWVEAPLVLSLAKWTVATKGYQQGSQSHQISSWEKGCILKEKCCWRRMNEMEEAEGSGEVVLWLSAWLDRKTLKQENWNCIIPIAGVTSAISCIVRK